MICPSYPEADAVSDELRVVTTSTAATATTATMMTIPNLLVFMLSPSVLEAGVQPGVRNRDPVYSAPAVFARPPAPAYNTPQGM